MRTNEQTYLSKLGFQDSDRNSDQHDMVCMRLSVAENAEKFVGMVTEELLKNRSNRFLYGIRQKLRLNDFLFIQAEDANLDRKIKVNLVTNNYNNNNYIVKKCKVIATDWLHDIGGTELSYFVPQARVYYDLVYNVEWFCDYKYEYSYDLNGFDLKDIQCVFFDGQSVERDRIEEHLQPGVADKQHAIFIKIIVEVKYKRENVTKTLQQLHTYITMSEYMLGSAWGVVVLATMYDLNDTEQEVLKNHGIVWINLNRLRKEKGQN